MSYKKEFSKRLKEVFKASGKTQKEIARAAKITPNQLSYYLAGMSTPSLATFCRLCDALDVEAEKLLGITKKSTL